MSVCQQCGACCASFRVSFYWAEAVQRGLPDSYTERVNPHLVSLAGTNRPAPRCCALRGEVGKQVACLVYPARPSPCRELQPGDDNCSRARALHGLAPIDSKRSGR
ncbi:MAG TPA: YkgJ family cysteine cluster protein [Steroidobacteraceae bacterium]